MASRRPSLFSPSASLRRKAISKGVLGGHRGWMAAAALLWGLNPVSPTAFMLRRNALYKGVLGGHYVWRVVGVVVWVPHLIRRMAGREEQLLTLETLKPGQGVRVGTVVPSSATRRQRRASKRAG